MWNNLAASAARPAGHRVRGRLPARLRAGGAGGRALPDRPVRGPVHLGHRGRPPGAAGGGHDAAAGRRVGLRAPLLAAAAGATARRRGRHRGLALDADRRGLVLCEPHPGIDADWLILGPAGSWRPPWWRPGRRPPRRWRSPPAGGSAAPRRSAVAAAAAAAGFPVPVVSRRPVRARARTRPVRACRSGRPCWARSRACWACSPPSPSRPGSSDAAANPARFGQTWQLTALLGLSGQDLGPAGQVLRAVAADPDVTGVDDARIGGAQSGQVSIESYTYDPVAGKRVPVVLTDGRMPVTRRTRSCSAPPPPASCTRSRARWSGSPAAGAAGGDGDRHRVRAHPGRTTAIPTARGSPRQGSTGSSGARTTPSSSTPPR